MFETYATFLLHTIFTPFLPRHEVNGAPMFPRAKAGISILELVIVVATIGILAAALSGGCVTTDARQGSAERNARAFATSMGWEIKGVVCSGADTPDRNGATDGYVSCTLSLAGDGDATKAILCGYDVAIAPLGQNTACKLTTPVTIQNQ